MKSKFDVLFEEVQSFLSNEHEEEIDDTICRICDKPFPIKGSKFDFYFSENEEKNVSPICYDCAQKVALENLDVIRSGEAELTEIGHPYERWTTCDSCEDLCPESEIKCTNVGKLCEYCIDGDISHGEQISIDYNCDVIG